MNIDMFSPFTAKAPSTHRIMSFGRELAKRGHNVSIILPCYDKYSAFTFEKSECIEGVKILRERMLKPKSLEANMLQHACANSLKSIFLKCDIVHVLKPNPLSCSGYLVKLFHKTPVVQDVDDLDYAVMMAEKHPKTRIWLVKQFETFLPKLADQIVTSSSLLKRKYIEMSADESKVSWIPNGVDSRKFNIKCDSSIKGQYNLKDKVIVYVGSLNNAEQLYPLLKAIRCVARERRDASCLIVGDGIARQHLQRLTHELNLNNYVIFAGKIPQIDVPKFLAISDIGFACFPQMNYIAAASNVKLFEYMASGLSVIVSPIGDLPYYVDFGNVGMITEPDSQNLSEALLELLGDDEKRKRLGEYARKYVRNKFDWSVLTGELLQIYERVAD